MGPLFHPRTYPITVNGKWKFTIIICIDHKREPNGNFSFLSATLLALIRSYNAAMVRKGRPGSKGKGSEEKLCAKTSTRTNKPRCGFWVWRRISFHRENFQTPDIVMQSCSQPNNKEAKVITNIKDEQEVMIEWLTAHPEYTIRSKTSWKTQNPKLLSGRQRVENLMCLVLVNITWKFVDLDKVTMFDFHLFSFQNCDFIAKIEVHVLPYIQNDITWILSDIYTCIKIQS